MMRVRRWLRLLLKFLEWSWWGIVKPVGTPLNSLREELRELDEHLGGQK